MIMISEQQKRNQMLQQSNFNRVSGGTWTYVPDPFDKNKHSKFGDTILKHMHPATREKLKKEFEKGEYYGFNICPNHLLLGQDSKGFKIGLVADFEFSLETSYAIRLGTCDTIEDCKLFVDQILYKDAFFNYGWCMLHYAEEEKIKKQCVKDYLLGVN